MEIPQNFWYYVQKGLLTVLEPGAEKTPEQELITASVNDHEASSILS